MQMGSEVADEELSMAYVYDSGGARIYRQKADGSGLNLTNIRQDVYLGGYERRQVKLIDTENSGNEASILTAIDNINAGTSDLTQYMFQNVDGTRLVKYVGLRAQWEYNDTSGDFDDPQFFLSFSNHLGSTSAVVDYSDGTLVEWKTNYAYGADESHWKKSTCRFGYPFTIPNCSA